MQRAITAQDISDGLPPFVREAAATLKANLETPQLHEAAMKAAWEDPNSTLAANARAAEWGSQVAVAQTLKGERRPQEIAQARAMERISFMREKDDLGPTPLLLMQEMLARAAVVRVERQGLLGNAHPLYSYFRLMVDVQGRKYGNPDPPTESDVRKMTKKDVMTELKLLRVDIKTDLIIGAGRPGFLVKNVKVAALRTRLVLARWRVTTLMQLMGCVSAAEMDGYNVPATKCANLEEVRFMLRERGYPDTGDESDARKRLADALELELEALYFPDKTGAGVTTDINHRIQASMQVIERSETREVQFGGIFGPGDSHGDLVRLRIHPDGELIWTTLAPFSMRNEEVQGNVRFLSFDLGSTVAGEVNDQEQVSIACLHALWAHPDMKLKAQGGVFEHNYRTFFMVVPFTSTPSSTAWAQM